VTTTSQWPPQTPNLPLLHSRLPALNHWSSKTSFGLGNAVRLNPPTRHAKWVSLRWQQNWYAVCSRMDVYYHISPSYFRMLSYVTLKSTWRPSEMHRLSAARNVSWQHRMPRIFKFSIGQLWVLLSPTIQRSPKPQFHQCQSLSQRVLTHQCKNLRVRGGRPMFIGRSNLVMRGGQ
jgi:hypothetical protein